MNTDYLKDLNKEQLIKVCPNGLNFISMTTLSDDRLQEKLDEIYKNEKKMKIYNQIDILGDVNSTFVYRSMMNLNRILDVANENIIFHHYKDFIKVAFKGKEIYHVYCIAKGIN